MKTFVELLNFPGGGIQAIIEQIEDCYLKTESVSVSDFAYKTMRKLEELAENAELLNEGEDIIFFNAVINIIMVDNSEPLNIELNNMITCLKFGTPLETVIKTYLIFAFQMLEEFERANIFSGCYNERLRLLIDMKFRKKRMDILREELMMVIFRPTRVERFFDIGYNILKDEIL
jgi:hypothetical protein